MILKAYPRPGPPLAAGIPEEALRGLSPSWGSPRARPAGTCPLRPPRDPRSASGLGYGINIIPSPLKLYKTVPDNICDGLEGPLQVIAGRGGPLQVGVTFI